MTNRGCFDLGKRRFPRLKRCLDMGFRRSDMDTRRQEKAFRGLEKALRRLEMAFRRIFPTIHRPDMNLRRAEKDGRVPPINKTALSLSPPSIAQRPTGRSSGSPGVPSDSERSPGNRATHAPRRSTNRNEVPSPERP